MWGRRRPFDKLRVSGLKTIDGYAAEAVHAACLAVALAEAEGSRSMNEFYHSDAGEVNINRKDEIPARRPE